MGQYADTLEELNTRIDNEQLFIDKVEGTKETTITIIQDGDNFVFTGTGGYIAASQAWLDANPSLDGSNGTDRENTLHECCNPWINTTEAERNALIAPRNAKKTEFVQDRDHLQVIVDNGESTENLPGDND